MTNRTGYIIGFILALIEPIIQYGKFNSKMLWLGTPACLLICLMISLIIGVYRKWRNFGILFGYVSIVFVGVITLGKLIELLRQ
jgi:hypothetical protein